MRRSLVRSAKEAGTWARCAWPARRMRRPSPATPISTAAIARRQAPVRCRQSRTGRRARIGSHPPQAPRPYCDRTCAVAKRGAERPCRVRERPPFAADPVVGSTPAGYDTLRRPARLVPPRLARPVSGRRTGGRNNLTVRSGPPGVVVAPRVPDGKGRRVLLHAARRGALCPARHLYGRAGPNHPRRPVGHMRDRHLALATVRLHGCT